MKICALNGSPRGSCSTISTLETYLAVPHNKVVFAAAAKEIMV